MLQSWTPKSKVAKAVCAAGFQYNSDQDIIISRMDAWQRDFGYAYAYDLLAPITISANIDCEPFFFIFDDKKWMIEVWKGQYGIETGGEVGVYVINEENPLLDTTVGHRPHNIQNSYFFNCADDRELLNISFTLFRNGKELFSRKAENHWWSTGFMWGVLSDPEDLSMEITITFDKIKMLNAFSESLTDSGYRDFSVDSKTIKFLFDSPKTYQPRKSSEWKNIIDDVKCNNVNIVEKYRSLSLKNNDPNHINDKKISREIVRYFNLYSNRNIRKFLLQYLKNTDLSTKDIIDIIEKTFKKRLNPIFKFLIKHFNTHGLFPKS